MHPRRQRPRVRDIASDIVRSPLGDRLVGGDTDAAVRAVGELYSDALGRPPEQARGFRLHDDGFVIVLRGGYLPSERMLCAAGRIGEVRHMRQILQSTLDPTVRAAVEDATGRRVRRSASTSDPRKELTAIVVLFDGPDG